MNIVILDFETSGLNPYHDDIIEIGAKIHNKDIEFNILLKPKSNHAISEKIKSITGITNKMLIETGYKWKEGYQLFIDWMNKNYDETSDNIIVSHNGNNFDFILFRKLIHDMNLPLNKYIYLDTLALSKRLIPNRCSYSQSALCRTHSIRNIFEHRAHGDVIALEKLFDILAEMLATKDVHLNMCPDYCNYNIY